MLCLAVCLLAAADAAAATDKTYGVVWKFSAKAGTVKEKATDANVCTFRSNGTFASGPIQNGTWASDGHGKFTAGISVADVQRIVDQLAGGPGINVTSIRQVKYKLKEDDKGAKVGKLKFQMKMRVHVNIPSEGIVDGHLDIKVKFSGRELP